MKKNNDKNNENENGDEYEHAFLFWANIDFYRDYKNKDEEEFDESKTSYNNGKNTMRLDGEVEEENSLSDDVDFKIEENTENLEIKGEKDSLLSNILNNTNSTISLSSMEKEIIYESSFFYNAHLLFESKASKYDDELTFLSPLYINQKKVQGGLGSATFGFIVKTNSLKEAEEGFWDKATNLAEDLNVSEFDIYTEITHITYSLLPYNVALKRLKYMNTLVLDSMKKLNKLINNKSKNMKLDDDNKNTDEDELNENIREMLKDVGDVIKKEGENPEIEEIEEELKDNNENNKIDNDNDGDGDGGMRLI